MTRRLVDMRRKLVKALRRRLGLDTDEHPQGDIDREGP